MIAGYTRPQLLIRQVLEVLPDQEERTLHAFAVGPQFDLHRYTNAEERAEMLGTAFVENTDTDPDARQLVPYEGLQPNNVVDQAFTRLYGEKLEGQVLLESSPVNNSDPNIYDFKLPSLLYPNRIQVIRRQAVLRANRQFLLGFDPIVSVTLIYGGSGYAPNATIDQPVIGGTGTGAVIRMTTNASGVVTAASVIAPGRGYSSNVTFSATAPNSGSNVGKEPDTNYTVALIPELHGRPIKPGDVVYATQGVNTTRRTVREVIRNVTPSSYGTDADVNDKKFLGSSLNPIRTSSASLGNISTPSNWLLEPARGIGLGFDVTNPGSGYTTPPTVVITPPIEINSGGLVWPANQAIGTAFLNDLGELDHIDVTFAGTGYYNSGLVHVIVEDGGSGYDASNPPAMMVLAGTISQPLLEPVISGGKITGVKIIKPGGGIPAPLTNLGFALTGASQAITMFGGAGSGAKIIAVPNTGCIRWITVTNHGTGYDDDVTVGGPVGGTNFAAKAYFGANSFTIAATGTDYAVNDIVELDGVGPVAYLNRKTRIKITQVNGLGAVLAAEIVPDYEGWYDGASPLPTSTNETTTALTGIGTGFQVELDWGVWLVRVTNPGNGYTSAPITFTPAGAGSAAAATASLVSPYAVTFTGGGGGGAAATMDTEASARDWNGLVEGSTYDGKYAERYTITVTKTGSGVDDAVVRIRSASGVFSANSVTAYHYGLDYIINDPALGGLVISLRPDSAGEPLKLGDTFTFVVTGAYLPLELASQGQLLRIDAPFPGTGFTPGTYDLVITSPSEPGGVQATAKGTVTGGGSFDPTSVIITNPGSGYIGAPLVTLPPAAGAGTSLYLDAIISTPENSRDLTVIQSSVYTGPRDTRYQIKVIQGTNNGPDEESFNGAIVRISDTSGIDEIQQYTITQGQQYDLGTYGLKFMFPADQATPSGIAGGTTATFSVQVSGGAVVAVDVTDGGSGYTQPPFVNLTGDGAGAYGHTVIHEGKVVAFVIDDGGSGYTTASVASVSAPTGYQGGLRTGDTYYVDAHAEAEDGDYSTIVLNGQATDISGWSESDLNTNKFNLDVRVLYSGIIAARRNTAPDLAWEAGTATVGGILVRHELALELTDRDSGFEWVPIKNATASKLFAHWRGLVPATSGDKIRLYYSEQGISEAFGKIDMDNPVCYGAVMAFRGGQEKPIFAAKLASNDIAGHTAMIRQAEHVEGIYAIALTTYDQSIKELWAAHVSKMSLENWKLWRRLYVGTQNPGPYAAMVTQSDGTDYIATVTTNASGNVRVVCANGDFVTRNIRPGDLYRTNFFYDAWGDPAYEEYEVYTVNTEDELILKTGPALPISPATKFEIWRPDTGLSQAEYVGEQSDNFLNRRVCNIWADEPNLVDTDGQLYVVPTYYLACEIAGLRAAVLPQQGLTYTELDHSLDGAPLMFTKYSEEELNYAASMGTWIVTQEQEDGPIFVRHQLTTESNKGILYYEDSIGTNVDNIAYAVKDIFQPYIGRRNTNVETLEEMETKLRDLLDSFKKNPGGFTNIGPALILWRDLSITIDPVFKDRINVKVTLELPLPINTIIVTLMATTASDETIATINATVNAEVTA